MLIILSFTQCDFNKETIYTPPPLPPKFCFPSVVYHSSIFFQAYHWDLFKFIMFYIYYSAIFVQFVLHCIAEKVDGPTSKPSEQVPHYCLSDISAFFLFSSSFSLMNYIFFQSELNPLYCFKQKPCPEKESSVLNRLYFWWLNP